MEIESKASRFRDLPDSGTLAPQSARSRASMARAPTIDHATELVVQFDSLPADHNAPLWGEHPLYFVSDLPPISAAARPASVDSSSPGGFQNQFDDPLRFESARARNGDVQAWAFGLVESIGREELFRQRKLSGWIAEMPPQVGQSLSRRNVVIGNRHK